MGEEEVEEEAEEEAEEESEEEAEEESEEEAEEESEEESDDEELNHVVVLKAFKKFAAAKAGNRDKALKVLAKYKVDAVKDLKKKDFAAVMKALK